MTAVQMIALSLGLSVGVAAIGGLAALLLRRVGAEPRLRERGWGFALWTPALPPLAIALLLLAPTPVVETAPAPVGAVIEQALPPRVAAPALTVEPDFGVDWNLAALVLLGLAGALALARLIALAVRALRLARLVRGTGAAPSSLVEAIHGVADGMGVRAPAVRVSTAASEALLAGLARPVLILPTAMVGDEERPEIRAVFAHELAHLKRRDHHALWLEEALLAGLAINPLLPLLRRGRAAAREEACDALALAGAGPEVRRAYARTLIEALKQSAGMSAPIPALTFTGARRSLAMSRLKAVLDPAPALGQSAQRWARLIVPGVSTLILGLAGGGAFAVAAQRAPQLVFSGQAADLPITARDTAWLNAALDPIYKAAWPKACGYGSNGDGSVFVHLGKGCTTDDVLDPVIESIAFVDPSTSPRDAFAAVKAACDAGQEVPIRFRQGGIRAGTAVRCATPAVIPPERTAFEVRLTWRGVAVQPGDRLVVALERTIGDRTFRRSLDFSLDDRTALPSSVKAMVEPEYFFGQHSPAMKTALIGRDGKVRAVSGDRPRPMVVRDREAVAYAELSPASQTRTAAEDAIHASVEQASATLTPEQRARYADPTGVGYKALCGSAAVGDEGFCSGVLFGMLPSSEAGAATGGVCPPRDASGDWDAHAVSEQGQRAVLGLSVRPGQSAREVARAALRTAFPCGAAASGTPPFRVTLERGGGERLPVGSGQRLVVQLTDAAGTPVSTVTTDRSGSGVAMTLADRDFPGIGQATRVYTLTGVLYGADGSVVGRAGPVTVRLAPGSRWRADLRPTLTFPA